MKSLFKQVSEDAAREALAAAAAKTPLASLTAAAQKTGQPAATLDIGPAGALPRLGKTTAFAEFRKAAMAENPAIHDIRAATRNVWRSDGFGFDQHSTAVIYVDKPHVLNQARTWMKL